MTIDAWPTGVERESSPGVYALLAAEIGGWRLWRFETATGVFLTAAKSAVGRHPSTPLGVAQALFDGKPSIHISIDKTLRGFVKGTHLHQIRAEYRVEGDRFLKAVPQPWDPSAYDGKRIELFIRSMPGPRSYSRVADDQGVIDMTGLAAIVAAGRQ